MTKKQDCPHISPEDRGPLIAALGEGNRLAVACGGVGVAVATFHEWKRRAGRGDVEAAGYRTFFDSCTIATAAAERAALRTVMSGDKGWNAAAWFLERRHPRRWGRKGPSAAGGAQFDVTAMNDEELHAAAQGQGPRRA